MLAGGLALAWAAGGMPAHAQSIGTQPGELTQDLRTATVCNGCHGGYDTAADDAWRGTMMANATRDPLFLAALTIANQDIPGAGRFCIRCHSPRAFLFGRATPTDGSAFEEDDRDGVSCDFCHRIVEAEGGLRPIGNGQYTVADDFVRRGPIREPRAPHDTAYSAYHESSELCGLCHDVSNDFRDGFPIERTYSEWLASSYPADGWSCMSCHLQSEVGRACGARDADNRIVHRHELAGGNTWIPMVLAGEHPELGREESYRRTADAARAQLEDAAEVTVTLPESVREGDELAFTVRVENRAGHKLPTGYTEGRQCWLEVVVTDAMGDVLLRSGAMDASTGRRMPREEDPQLRTYEGRIGAGGVEGFHFVLQDTAIEDTRIPPRGFVPADDTRPIGRDYPVQPDGSLAHWDDAPYRVLVPRRTPGPLRVSAKLWYQTASREYVEFLRDENVTDDRGQRIFDLWETYGRSAPVEMSASSASMDVTPRPEEGCAAAGRTGKIDAGPWVGLLAILSGSAWVRAQRRRRGGNR